MEPQVFQISQELQKVQLMEGISIKHQLISTDMGMGTVMATTVEIVNVLKDLKILG